MNKLTVSIVTPSYNQGLFIERTIQSVLNQNKQLEYVVVDGGSTDDTISILKKYSNQLRWISEKDHGQADAVNKGLRMTSGDIIGWLNSDDIYYPQAIKTVCDYFRDHPEVDVVYGKAYEIDRDDKVLQLYPTRSWSLKRLKTHCFISQPATFFRRRVVEKHGGLNPQLHLCLDYEYWLRLGIHQVKFNYLPHVLAGSRIYAETKSSRFYLEAHVEAINMLQKQLNYIPSEWIVNHACAKVKVENKLYFPHPRFMMQMWLNVWKTTGVYNKGLKRILVWQKAQLAMLRKFAMKARQR